MHSASPFTPWAAPSCSAQYIESCTGIARSSQGEGLNRGPTGGLLSVYRPRGISLEQPCGSTHAASLTMPSLPPPPWVELTFELPSKAQTIELTMQWSTLGVMLGSKLIRLAGA